MEWADAKKLVCVRIFKMYDWILNARTNDSGNGLFSGCILDGFWVLVGSPRVVGG